MADELNVPSNVSEEVKEIFEHDITDTHEIVTPKDKEQKTSPVIEKEKGKPLVPEMTFFRAMEFLATGSKIHKLEWDNPAFYGVLDGGQVMLHKPDGKMYQWIINEGDMIGTDWIVVK